MESIYLKKCNCKNYSDEHYFNKKTNEIVYINDNSDEAEITCKNNRCNYFFNRSNLSNQCLRTKCSYKHVKDNELPNVHGKMSLTLNKHTRNGIFGWFIIIDNEETLNIMNNIHNIKSLITIQDRKNCIEFIKLIYNTKLYYNIINELNKNELGVSCDFLIEKFNLLYIFGKINIELNLELISPLSVLTYLPGIYRYDKLYYNKKRQVKRKITAPGSNNFKIPNNKLLLSDSEKQLRKNKPIIFQPKLNEYNNWVEQRSRIILINNIGVIYYVNKITNEKTWKHPITQETNLPGGYKTPEEAGLINNA